jgi:prevent-host-death family protein
MTKSAGVHEAKTHLSRLLQLVEQGEEVEITRRGEVVARLVPPRPAGRRELGFARGQVVIAEDFDAPLPDDLVAAFEGR